MQVQVETEMALEPHEAARLPSAWAMSLVMAVCVLVWAANVYTGMDFMKPKPEDLYRWGGNASSAVQAGEWWRLLTNIFLHGGAIHLTMNMFALWESGLILTRLFGNRGFLFVYFCSGIVGSALSLFFAAQTHVAVGASGAIFGVMGALLVAVMRHQDRMPAAYSKRLKTGLGVFIVLSLLFGFIQPGIDNAAHIGGLLAGMLCGLVVTAPAGTHSSSGDRNLRLLGGTVVFGALVMAMVQFSPPAKHDMRVIFHDMQAWADLQPQFIAYQKALLVDVASMQSGKISPQQFSRLLYEKHIPAIRQIEIGLARLRLPEDEFSGRAVKAQRLFLDASIKWFAAVLLYDAERSQLAKLRMQEQEALFQQRVAEMKALNDAISAAAKKS